MGVAGCVSERHSTHHRYAFCERSVLHLAHHAHRNSDGSRATSVGGGKRIHQLLCEKTLDPRSDEFGRLLKGESGNTPQKVQEVYKLLVVRVCDEGVPRFLALRLAATKALPQRLVDTAQRSLQHIDQDLLIIAPHCQQRGSVVFQLCHIEHPERSKILQLVGIAEQRGGEDDPCSLLLMVLLPPRRSSSR